MQPIIDEIEASLGPLLAEQGLKAVYEYASDPDVEDDLVVFTTPSGAKSVVYLQVSSLHPSLDAAEVNLSVIETSDLPFDGWKIVESIGMLPLPGGSGKEAVLRKAAIALRENAGAFDLPDSVRHGLLTHPKSKDTFGLLSKVAHDSDGALSIRPYVTGDAEGFEVRAQDGRAARVEMRDGQYQVTALGERVSVPYSAANCNAALTGMLADKLGPQALRP